MHTAILGFRTSLDRIFDNLCRAESVGVVTNEEEYALLGDVQLSELDLIFITGPECSYRDRLLSSFLQKYSNERRCAVDYDELVSLLHFIAQVPSSKNAQQLSGNHMRLFKASENLLWSRNTGNTYQSKEKREDFCRNNMELFCCAIVPCLDVSGWRSRMVASILRNLCQVYLDVVTTELRAKISTAFQMIVTSLPVDKQKKALNVFCQKISAWQLNQTVLLCGMRRVLAMLSRFSFFDQYRMRAAYYIFKTILKEGEKENQSAGIKDNNTAVDMMEEGEDLPEDSVTLRDAFGLVPKVVKMLVDKPTDFYAAMQLLHTCIAEAVLQKQDLKTLLYLQECLNIAKYHMKITVRLDDRIIDSLCDAPHSIQMIINAKRRLDPVDSLDEEDESDNLSRGHELTMS